MTTTTTTDAFEDVIAGWGEAIACKSVHGCSGQATWLAIPQKPCDGPKAICAEHVLRWMGEAMEIIAEWGEIYCPGLWRGVPDARTMHPFPAAVGAKLLPPLGPPPALLVAGRNAVAVYPAAL